MRHLWIVGVGAGDPRGLTMEAAEAIARADVFVVLDKGGPSDELAALRHELLDRHARPNAHRVLEIPDTTRDVSLDYRESVRRWHRQRVNDIEAAIATQIGEDEVGAMLVWGDPAVYDSTIRVVEQILERHAVRFDFTVIPGISSIQLLCARHRITLNRIGRSVLMTTGRLLQSGAPDGVDDIVVLLDAATTFTRFVGQGYEIFWGAYLGTPDEILIAGPLDDTSTEIVEARAAARARKGWVFDTYLLRRIEQPSSATVIG